ARAGEGGRARGRRSPPARARGARRVPPPSRARGRRARRGAAARGPQPRGRPGHRVRLRAVRLQGAGDGAGPTRSPADLIATALAIATVAAAPVPADAYGIATRIASWGPRPAASAREAKVHRLVRRTF